MTPPLSSSAAHQAQVAMMGAHPLMGTSGEGQSFAMFIVDVVQDRIISASANASLVLGPAAAGLSGASLSALDALIHPEDLVYQRRFLAEKQARLAVENSYASRTARSTLLLRLISVPTGPKWFTLLRSRAMVDPETLVPQIVALSFAPSASAPPSGQPMGLFSFEGRNGERSFIRLDRGEPSAPIQLSPAERAVVLQMGLGYSLKRTAKLLKSTEFDVRARLRHLLDLTGAGSPAELYSVCFNIGLI